MIQMYHSRYRDICWTRVSFYSLLKTLTGFTVVIYVDSTSERPKNLK